jgi:hypothetical protein
VRHKEGRWPWGSKRAGQTRPGLPYLQSSTTTRFGFDFGFCPKRLCFAIQLTVWPFGFGIAGSALTPSLFVGVPVNLGFHLGAVGHLFTLPCPWGQGNSSAGGAGGIFMPSVAVAGMVPVKWSLHRR